MSQIQHSTALHATGVTTLVWKNYPTLHLHLPRVNVSSINSDSLFIITIIIIIIIIIIIKN